MPIALCLAKIQDRESMNLTFRVILSLSHVQILCSSDLGKYNMYNMILMYEAPNARPYNAQDWVPDPRD